MSSEPYEQRSTDLFAKLLPDDDPYVFEPDAGGEEDLADSDYNETSANKRQRKSSLDSVSYVA